MRNLEIAKNVWTQRQSNYTHIVHRYNYTLYNSPPNIMSLTFHPATHSNRSLAGVG